MKNCIGPRTESLEIAAFLQKDLNNWPLRKSSILRFDKKVPNFDGKYRNFSNREEDAHVTLSQMTSRYLKMELPHSYLKFDNFSQH